MKTDPAMHEVIDAASRTVATEISEPCTLRVLEGAVPADLRGVLLRNGPGRQSRGGVRYGHPFDGDGFVQRLAFSDDGVSYRARFVRTREYEAEEAVDRVLYRGFGTQKPGGITANLLRLRFKNAANTSVVHHGGVTLALWEGGQPHAIDPETLATLGRYDYAGALRTPWPDRVLAPERPFSAHPKRCPRTGELFNFGTAYGRTNQLLVYTIDPSGHANVRAVPLQGLPFVHDMVCTDHWLGFMLPAAGFDVPRTLLGLKSPVRSLTLRDAPGCLLLVPRDGAPAVSIEVSAGFVFHWAHAYERGGQLVVEGVKYGAFPALDDIVGTMASAGAPDLLATAVRFVVDPVARTVREEVLHDHPVELPTVRGHGPDRVVFATAAPVGRRQPYLSGLARHDARGLTFRDWFPDLPGEPLVCGDWLVTQVWRATTATTEVWVLDPEDLRVVSRLGLPRPVPLALHGTWIPSLSGP